MNFDQNCYQLLKQIEKILNTKAYRAVGNAMANNPKPIIFTCHRVINSNGSIGGDALGINIKINLLKNEGITIKKVKS